MSIQQTEFIRFIKLLNDNDVLQDVIVIGSWAEFLYKECRLLPGFEANIKTLDIDFLLKNLRRPNPPKNVATLAKESGYIVQQDIMDGTTKILDKEGLEIEFLINKIGAGTEETMKSNLGVTAQAFRHMNILTDNAINVNYVGFNITVPKPEAYAIHKMIINKDRKNMQEKDWQAVINIYPFLSQEQFNAIANKLTKKELEAVNDFIADNKLLTQNK